MNLLIVESAQAGGIETKTRGLWPDIWREMKSAVGVEVGMTIETGHAVALLRDLAVLGLIKFFLRQRGEKKTQAFHLNWRDDTVHDFIEIANGEQLPARHVSQFWT